MPTDTNAPLILTLELAPEAQAWAQAMRDAYFPPERNIVPAHISLFHALPPDCEDLVRACLTSPRSAPEVWIERRISLVAAWRIALPARESPRSARSCWSVCPSIG